MVTVPGVVNRTRRPQFCCRPHFSPAGVADHGWLSHSSEPPPSESTRESRGPGKVHRDVDEHKLTPPQGLPGRSPTQVLTGMSSRCCQLSLVHISMCFAGAVPHSCLATSDWKLWLDESANHRLGSVNTSMKCCGLFTPSNGRLVVSATCSA
jgi:hypothetical protein